MMSQAPLTLPTLEEKLTPVPQLSLPSAAPKISPAAVKDSAATVDVPVGGGAGSMYGSMGTTRFPTPFPLSRAPMGLKTALPSFESSAMPLQELASRDKADFSPIAIIGIILASFLVGGSLSCYFCRKKFHVRKRKDENSFSAPSEASVGVKLTDDKAREIT